MSQERVMEIRQQLFLLERRIRPLEWDSNRSQINEYRKKELDVLKQQHKALLDELNTIAETIQKDVC